MTEKNRYQQQLIDLDHDEWEPFLLAESGLPGPRGNLELASVVADLGTREMFEGWLQHTADLAPTNDPREFLAFCGVLGFGRIFAQGQKDVLPMLRCSANDSRWRMREAVVMALEYVGETRIAELLAIANEWITGTLLEQRAAVAAVCHPQLLRQPEAATAAVRLLDQATVRLTQELDRRSDGFMALRKGLGYCWSIAIAAAPDLAKPAFEDWLVSDDRDVRWLLKENLGKARLVRAEPKWVGSCLARLAG